MKSPYWLLVGLLFAGGAQAIPHYGPGGVPGSGMAPGMGPGPYARVPRMAARQAAPAAALRAGMDKLLAFLGREEKPSPDALAAFLNTEIAPFFDFDFMAKSAGGRLFERLDADQQLATVDRIRQSFLAKMAEKLGSYEKQQVRFLPPRGANDRTAQVSVAILNPGRYPGRLDFRLYRNADQWLVYDVSANGQSAIVHYRNQLMRDANEQRMQQMRQRQPPVRRMAPQPYVPRILHPGMRR